MAAQKDLGRKRLTKCQSKGGETIGAARFKAQTGTNSKRVRSWMPKSSEKEGTRMRSGCRRAESTNIPVVACQSVQITTIN